MLSMAISRSFEISFHRKVSRLSIKLIGLIILFPLQTSAANLSPRFLLCQAALSQHSEKWKDFANEAISKLLDRDLELLSSKATLGPTIVALGLNVQDTASSHLHFRFQINDGSFGLAATNFEGKTLQFKHMGTPELISHTEALRLSGDNVTDDDMNLIGSALAVRTYAQFLYPLVVGNDRSVVLGIPMPNVPALPLVRPPDLVTVYHRSICSMRINPDMDYYINSNGDAICLDKIATFNVPRKPEDPKKLW